MKRICFAFFALFFSVSFLFAQNQFKGSVIASNREDLLSKLPSEISYFMPEFTLSQIFYKNGTKFMALLNICVVDNSVRYINESGDTLLMANASDVNRIFAQGSVYKQINGHFFQELVAFGQTSLCEKRSFSLKEPEISIGFANIAPTSTAKSYNPEHEDLARDYGKDMEIDYTMEIDYVLSHKDKIYPCKQSAFIKFFPEKKQQIKDFVKINKIDFSNREHVLSLFYMCTEK